MTEETYEVQTPWGWFRLDRASYRDYMAGKLWISTARPTPGAGGTGAAAPARADALPPEVTPEALRLRDASAKRGVYEVLQETCPGREVTFPYRSRMSGLGIEEMNLSVRASNGLMRAGAQTFGALWELMIRENGLRSVRNLGAKSEAEIRRCFFVACYALLSAGEQALFWQRVLDS